VDVLYVYLCMCVAAWSELCETHIVGPSGVLTGYTLLVIYLHRGIATRWTGVGMSTPLLPEVVPEIDANPVTLYSGGQGLGRVGHGLELDSPFTSIR